MTTPLLLSVPWARGRYDVYTFNKEEADEAEDEDKDDDVDEGEDKKKTRTRIRIRKRTRRRRTWRGSYDCSFAAAGPQY